MPGKDKSSNAKFFIRYTSAILVLAAFYVTNYVCTRIYLNKIANSAPEINVTMAAQPLDATVLSITHSVIASGRILSLTAEQTLKWLVDTEIDQMQAVNQDLVKMHLENIDNYPSTYTNAYTQIISNDLCDSAESLGFNVECNTYIAGTMRKGLLAVMIQYVELIREMVRLYQSINGNMTSTQAQKLQGYKTLLNYTATPELDYAQTIVHELLESSFVRLLDALTQAFDDMLAEEITRRIILFIIFLILFVLACVMLWLPFIAQLSTEIWRTKCMLTIIPKEVIAQMKSVQKFLNDPNIFSAKGEA